MSSWINLTALWRIIVVAVLLGAGLPALFAVGLRALTLGTPTPAPVPVPIAPDGSSPNSEAPGAPTTLGATDAPINASLQGRLLAALCFAVVLAAIGWGIYTIVHQS